MLYAWSKGFYFEIRDLCYILRGCCCCLTLFKNCLDFSHILCEHSCTHGCSLLGQRLMSSTPNGQNTMKAIQFIQPSQRLSL